jgi:hypothetical protein
MRYGVLVVRVTSKPRAWIWRMWLQSLLLVPVRVPVVARAEVGVPGGGVGGPIHGDAAASGIVAVSPAAPGGQPSDPVIEEGDLVHKHVDE